MALRSRRRRRPSARRRAHRNKPLSAAHKRKISLSLKRRSSGSSRKSSSRPVKMRTRTRTRTKTVVRYRGRSRSVARRRSHSVARRAGGFIRRQAIGVKSLFSKDVMTVAGGAVGASMLSSYVIMHWGAKLPGATNPIGMTLYRAGIGLGGAMLTQRFNRKLAEGMLIGTAVMVINDALRYAMSGSLTGASAYPRAVGGPIGGRRLATPPVTRGARGFTPGYQASNSFGGALNNQSAFPGSAWSN